MTMGTVSAAGMRRYAMPGESIRAPNGLHGTIGVIGVDRESGDPVALTAMHVVPGIREFPAPPRGAPVFQWQTARGGSASGTLLRGTRRGIDAAAIRVGSDAVSNEIPGIGTIEHWRALDLDADVDRPVRMRGAASGRVTYGRVLLPAAHVPDWSLVGAIIVQIAAIAGDSGAPLVDDDGMLLGLLVGGNETRQLFTPIDRVFAQLSCRLYLD